MFEAVSPAKKAERRAAVHRAARARVQQRQDAPGHYEKALDRWKDKRKVGAQNVRARMKKLIALFDKD